MYYYQPLQSNTSFTTPNYAQVQDWEHQRQSDEAMELASQHYKGVGWDPVNTQQIGSCFRVHLRDQNGDYHTVTLDKNGNILQNQGGYL